MKTVTLGNLCSILTGKLDVNAHDPDGAYPFFTCAKENYAIDTYAFDGESILIAGNGDLNAKYYVGKFNAYQRTYVLQKFVFNGKYLFWIITHNLDLLRLGARGSTIKYIRLGDLQNMEIPLYSVSQQQAIVDEIEKQFSRLDNGLQSLESIEADLKSYKASVLKSAVEGKLTEKRRKNQKNLEPANILLERILAGRKQKREQENPGKKYKEPKKINTEGLADIPEGWCWTNVEHITSNQEYGSSAKANTEGDVPVLRMGNLQDGKLDFNDLKYFPQDHFDVKKLELRDKDLLFCRTNGSPELVGKCAIYYKEKHPSPCTFAGYLIRVQTFYNLFCIEYLYYCLISPYGRSYINKVKSSINQNNVSGEKLANMPFPLPPLKEQQQIKQEVEEKLSIVEVILGTIEANIKRAKQLKQSILHQAFTGQLVPMKDDNKGVEELLAEIEKTKTIVIGQNKNKKTKQK